MEPKVIRKQDSGTWLRSLAEKFELIAPVTEDGVTYFRPVSGPSEVAVEGSSGPAKSIREHFTPETETLFDYTLSGLAAEVKPPGGEAPRERVIFGVRACDAAALLYVDAVYSNVEPIDTAYFERRKQTYLIGLFCDKPAWSCFCTEVGDFLTNPTAMDACMTDIGDRYYVEPLTPTGEDLLGLGNFRPADEKDASAAQEVRKKALSRLPNAADHGVASQTYDWDHLVWADLARKCLGCGVCSYICPTCHCFDIQELPMRNYGSRFRCWDTCQFEKFTLMGAGHNPRPTKKERTRQRIFHKFKYSIDRYGRLGCVGCGRCIAACPVNVDIRQAIGELEKKATEPVGS